MLVSVRGRAWMRIVYWRLRGVVSLMGILNRKLPNLKQAPKSLWHVAQYRPPVPHQPQTEQHWLSGQRVSKSVP